MLQETLRNKYEMVIGLEVHCQMKTRTKLFCSCPNQFGDTPNTNVCPVCLGLPGALPVISREAVTLALRAALATNCTVHETSIFSRKNYFYPDLPKGYQISQYDRPYATDGKVEALASDGSSKTVRLERIHMEEDAGKLLHEGFPWSKDMSGVDLNRSGAPLIEIVSKPDIRSAQEAHAYLTSLKAILVYADVSDCNMEEGSLRCDANVSVRLRGAEAFGTRAEIKNLNSFRNVSRAIEYEYERQVGLVEAGHKVVQETRLYRADKDETASMRSKEDAHDYRYFPEPDLPPLVIDAGWRADTLKALPELPSAKRARFVSEYGIPHYDAEVLTLTREVADFFEAVAKGCRNGKAASNWIMTEVMREMKGRASADGEVSYASWPITPGALAELIVLVDKGAINGKTAKDVFARMWTSGESPQAIVEREGLSQVSDTGAIEAAITEVIAGSPEQVATYKKGRTNTIGWFVGQVMKKTGGRANPKMVNDLVKAALDS
ncbi:MAG: Asp-tRNA(Asn)/Glu-tRNA(Gln) amidotransferase subunit GatB [Vicinamibacteria bacterium]|nr:Asp-tRNA(Asn)/Glu-tRNA(Gln) amidotransferase subunit GatB [Vicinamibacteria bacterium]MBP9944864.1 Asp-tRNA(Asn)/Glu-tRNA(Gln) amidotransferase subunit GatB [Vicinamibacteria bacterium]